LCDPDSIGGGVSADKLNPAQGAAINFAAARAGQGAEDVKLVSAQSVAERLAANEAAYTAGQAIDDAVDILLESFEKKLGVSSEGEHFGEEVFTCMKQMCRKFDGIRSFKVDDHVMKFARSVRSSLKKCRMEKDEIEFTVQYVNEMWMKGGGQLKVCKHVYMRVVRTFVCMYARAHTHKRARGHTHAHTHTHTHTQVFDDPGKEATRLHEKVKRSQQQQPPPQPPQPQEQQLQAPQHHEPPPPLRPQAAAGAAPAVPDTVALPRQPSPQQQQLAAAAHANGVDAAPVPDPPAAHPAAPSAEEAASAATLAAASSPAAPSDRNDDGDGSAAALAARAPDAASAAEDMNGALLGETSPKSVYSDCVG
jgi:hypothetical protein